MSSFEQLEFERRFRQDQIDTARLTGPIYVRYENLPSVAPVRSSLENLPLPARRGPDGKIIPRGPIELPAAPVEHVEVAPAPSVEALSEQIAEIFKVLDELCRRTGVQRG